MALALTVALVLLVALQRVISLGTERAALRHAALSQQADAQWRCRLLTGLPDRRLCLVALTPVSTSE